MDIIRISLIRESHALQASAILFSPLYFNTGSINLVFKILMLQKHN